jgi:hypothetical protein
MPDPVINAILVSWAAQRDYVQKLVADLTDADMVSQPVPGVTMNHPAWTLGHLSPYHHVCAAMLMGEPFSDPMHATYAKGTKPSTDAAAYPPKATLLTDYLAGHDLLTTALKAADPSVLAKPIPLARWQERFPRIADALLYLMLSHEATHLGQISSWRRAGNRPAV